MRAVITSATLPMRSFCLPDLDWVRCSIRPPARGYHEYVDWFRSATELCIQHDGRVGQICAPNGTVHGRQPLLDECLDAVDDLSFGLTGQYHLRSFVRQRQDGAGSRRIEANRTSNSRVPKIGGILTVDWAHPPSLHDAYETILAFDRGFIAIPSQNQDLGIERDGLRGRTPRQGYLGVAIRHQILVKRSHARIRCFGVLC